MRRLALFPRSVRLVACGVAVMLLAGTGAAEPKAKEGKGATTTAGFVAHKPPSSTQTSKSVAERGARAPRTGYGHLNQAVAWVGVTVVEANETERIGVSEQRDEEVRRIDDCL